MEASSLSLCPQGKRSTDEARPDLRFEEQAPYLVASLGARGALQQSPILR